MLLFGFGMGLNFVTLTLTAVSGISDSESGAASGMLNTTQQVGGALGLSILTTVFSSASTDEAKTQVGKFLAEATPEQRPSSPSLTTLRTLERLRARPWHLGPRFIVAAALAGLAALIALFAIQYARATWKR